MERTTQLFVISALLIIASQAMAAGSAADAVIKWQWLENTLQPGVTDVMSMPAVGDINGDGVSDIVFVAADISDDQATLTLVALSGDTGRVHWILDDVEGLDFDVNASPVIGDLEGDGQVEVCLQAFDDSDSGLVCLAGDGTFQTFYDIPIPGNGPALADLDGDGQAEILTATTAFDLDGNVLASTDLSPQYGISFAGDIDRDGVQELITERAILAIDGRTLWTSTSRYGGVALADIDRDGYVELIQSIPDPAELRCMNIAQNGGMCWSTELRDTPESAGPPTIADFDGDGYAEIAVASFTDLYVYDHEGRLAWSVQTHDLSSGAAGISAFDFDADGDYELVYADEETFRIFDGRNGEVLFQYSDHGSGTWLEYPVVADVDNDGAAEVVLGSNRFFETGVSGITVFESGGEPWAPARKYWNQHAYSFTNINNDGSIPSSPTPSWWCSATFRAQGYEIDDICEEIPIIEPYDPEEEVVIFLKGGGVGSCSTTTPVGYGGASILLLGCLVFALRRSRR